MTLKIGNAQGFWGDRLSAPKELVEKEPDLDFLTLEYLAELTMSILAAQREKKQSEGYIADFLFAVRSLVPYWKKGQRFRVVTNAGGLNPKACAFACHKILQEMGCRKKIGIVTGDDIFEIVQKGGEYKNLDTKESIFSIKDRLVSANAYLGSSGIVDALDQGADIVITGRVTDTSLTVGPCVSHFGWGFDEYDKLAQATIAGHLIECGTQVTGGISTNWEEIPDKVHIGFPLVEIDKEADFIITKPKNTGGRVDLETVKEQLLYEIGDPAQFLTPDVTVSFLTIKLEDEGGDRVRVSGATGKRPTDSYKASLCYKDGFRAEASLTIHGQDAGNKARLCGKIVLDRVRDAGFDLQRSCVEVLGEGKNECVLRVACADERKEALDCFVREIAPLVTSGPQGVTGYTTGRAKIRPIFGFFPVLIEKDKVLTKVEII